MKSSLLIPVTLFLVLVCFLFFKTRHRVHRPSPENEVTEVAAPPPSRSMVVTPPKIAPAVVPAKSTPPPEAASGNVPFLATPRQTGADLAAKPATPPPHALTYRRRGKLIIVFGDVLYGQLKDDHAADTGFVRVKPLETWDGPIPYAISSHLKNPERVMKTLQLFEAKTSVRFIPFSGQPNAISFEPGEKDCLSYVGRIGGHQPIYLDDKCDVPEITHEIMHALGFIHEQSRPDREQFIRIHWENIDPDNVSQFEVAPDEVTKVTMARPFDYKSVMLYDPTIFAKSPTLKTMDSATSEAIEPVPNGLSIEDVLRISKVYGP